MPALDLLFENPLWKDVSETLGSMLLSFCSSLGWEQMQGELLDAHLLYMTAIKTS